MIKFRRRLAILTAALVMVTMTGTGVFATGLSADEAGDGSVQAFTEATDETSGTGEETETTDPIDIANAEIQAIPDQTYTGAEIVLDEEDLVVTYTDEETVEHTLVIGTDYTAAYENNIEVGTATVIITGIGDYTGTNSATFNIVEKTDKPSPVKKVTALAGFNAIKLTWKAPADMSNVDYYYIERLKGGTVDRTRMTSDSETAACAWENAYKLKKNTKYVYRVYSVKQVGSYPDLQNDIMSDPVSSEKTQMVRRLVIKVTMKTTVGALKAGKTYSATGFGSGQYKIPKGSRTYSIARYKVYNQKAVYQKKGKLSEAAVEFFMNGGSTWAKGKKYSYIQKSGFSTSKKYFVWVNTYNQHAYVLKKKSSKKYEMVDHWKVSMGTAKTPSPMGTKTIIKYRAYHPGHGAPYWNFISWSSSANHGTALHGLESGWASKLGTLASHGCIRNPSAKAQSLQTKYSGVGMKVLIY